MDAYNGVFGSNCFYNVYRVFNIFSFMNIAKQSSLFKYWIVISSVWFHFCAALKYFMLAGLCLLLSVLWFQKYWICQVPFISLSLYGGELAIQSLRLVY